MSELVHNGWMDEMIGGCVNGIEEEGTHQGSQPHAQPGGSAPAANLPSHSDGSARIRGRFRICSRGRPCLQG